MLSALPSAAASVTGGAGLNSSPYPAVSPCETCNSSVDGRGLDTSPGACPAFEDFGVAARCCEPVPPGCSRTLDAATAARKLARLRPMPLPAAAVGVAAMLGWLTVFLAPQSKPSGAGMRGKDPRRWAARASHAAPLWAGCMSDIGCWVVEFKGDGGTRAPGATGVGGCTGA